MILIQTQRFPWKLNIFVDELLNVFTKLNDKKITYDIKYFVLAFDRDFDRFVVLFDFLYWVSKIST